jgi:hypothetical protein
MADKAKPQTATSTTMPGSGEASPGTPPPMGYIHPLTPSEITIDIWPRMRVKYHGTWEQLQAEGLLSEDVLSFPRTDWEEGIYSYRLVRCRPDGAKRKDCPGPIDYWMLAVGLVAGKGKGLAAARQYDLEQKVREAKFNASEAGRIQRRRGIAALQDNAFQNLLVAVGAKQLRPKRKAKAQAEAARTEARD